MLKDLTTYLPFDILVKMDRSSMASSFETRAPFLDYRVAEYAWKIPIDYKLNNSGYKILANYPLEVSLIDICQKN